MTGMLPSKPGTMHGTTTQQSLYCFVTDSHEASLALLNLYRCSNLNLCLFLPSFQSMPKGMIISLSFLQVQPLPSGAISLSFGAKSDPLSQDISALVLHLYNSEVKQEVTTGKAPALAAVTEVCIVYCAVTYCGLYWPHSIEVLHDNVPALAVVTAVT